MELSVPRQRVFFRPYRISDRRDLVNIIQSVGRERLYLQTDRYVPTQDWEIALSGEAVPTQHQLFVLENQHQMIGFVRLFPDAGWAFPEPDKPQIGEVGIVLLPPFRSQRIGTKALEQIIAIARQMNYSELTAYILSANLRSIRLFAGFSFVEIERKKRYLDYLDKLVDESVMSLEI